MPAYADSTHVPKSTAPAIHITANTTATGNSRNPSKAGPIPLDTGGAAMVLGFGFGFVVSCFVGIPHTLSLAASSVRRYC